MSRPAYAPAPRTSLVTGAARRIGRAIALDLAAAGWGVVIHYGTSGAEAEELAASINAGTGRAATVGGDLADLASPDRIMADAFAALGPIGLLVNSASMFASDDVGSLDAALFERQLRVNLTAPVLLVDALVRRLPQDMSALVVNIVDQRVLKLTPRHVSYTLAKSGLYTATRTLAQALAPRIRVNAIGPGPTYKSDGQTPADFAAQVAALPLQRGPDPSEFGRTIRMMVETPSLTGQMICLDGGQHLAWETPDVIGVGEE